MKVVSFRVDEEICTTFKEKFGNGYLSFFLRRCLQKAIKEGDFWLYHKTSTNLPI